MSLIKLLAVGRSIIGVQSESNRFAIVGDGFLPKFGTGSGVAREIGHDAPPNVSGLLSKQNQPGPVSDGLPMKVAPSKMTSVRVDTSSEPGELPPDKNAVSLFAGFSTQTASLFRSLNPFAVRRPANFKLRAARGGARLDTLHVVRSALDEADVEFVPAQINPDDPNLPPRRRLGGARSALPGQRWSVLAARLFEVGRLRL